MFVCVRFFFILIVVVILGIVSVEDTIYRYGIKHRYIFHLLCLIYLLRTDMNMKVLPCSIPRNYCMYYSHARATYVLYYFLWYVQFSAVPTYEYIYAGFCQCKMEICNKGSRVLLCIIVDIDWLLPCYNILLDNNSSDKTRQRLSNSTHARDN